jgi:hypothetical protein
MFRALLGHRQEALHRGHLVHCVRVMSVGCTRIGLDRSGAGSEDEQVMLEICRGP